MENFKIFARIPQWGIALSRYSPLPELKLQAKHYFQNEIVRTCRKSIRFFPGNFVYFRFFFSHFFSKNFFYYILPNFSKFPQFPKFSQICKILPNFTFFFQNSPNFPKFSKFYKISQFFKIFRNFQI
jgi:hypothetical protein